MSDLDNISTHQDNTEDKSCLNCNATVQEDFLYCAKCSQRLRTSKISVGSLLSEFVSSMFNFDSRFFQSFFKLWQPGRLTKEYISGRRKRYLNPARFFLFCMIFHFAVLGYMTKDANEDLNGIDNMLPELAAEADLLHKYDSLVTVLPIDTIGLDTLRTSLFSDMSKRVGDSIPINNAGFINLDGIPGHISKKYHIDDIADMEESEFLDHYAIEGFNKRIFTKQMLRMSRNPQGVYTFFLGNLLWAAVLSIVFLSFVLKLLYVRSKRFFVEHLILLMHVHSFIFIIVGIGMLADKYISKDSDPLWTSFMALAGLLYFFVSMYFYYEQGIFKTIIKYLFILFSYLFIIIIFVVFILFISLLIF